MWKTKLDLGSPNVALTILRLALPAVFAQIANLLYNIVGRIFIGQTPDGAMAMAGIGITFPITMLISALTALIGNGGAPLAAIALGKKDDEEAEKILGNSFIMLILISIFITVFFTVFKVPILTMLGASDATLGYASEFLGIFLLGTIFMQLTLGLNPFINTQGYTHVGMISITIGAVINLILSPLFILHLDWGVRGAALAGVIAQFFSMLWILRFLYGDKTRIKIRKKNLRLDKYILIKIVGLGFTPFIIMATEGVIITSLNIQLLRFGGDMAVVSMAIMLSIVQIITLPIGGFAQGVQPILSFNYGAKNYDRVRDAVRIMFIGFISFNLVSISLLMVFPELFIRIFNNEPDVIVATSAAIRIYFLGFFILGAQTACQQTFIALGQGKQSASIAILRKVLLITPLIFILPMLFENQHHAVLFAVPISDLISTVIALCCFVVFYRRNLKVQE